MADIHVVIVNYNAGPFLLRAVDSVMRQPCVSRVIVVDNASRDKSMEKLDQRAAGDQRVVMIRNERNLGFACACNMGVRAAAAEFLLFLNPDCEVQDGALEMMIDTLRKDDCAGMAGPLVLNADGTEQAGGRRAVPTPWRSFVRAFGLSKYRDRYPKLFPDFLLHEEPLPHRPSEVEAISGSCMLVKSEAVKKVGLLDEQYFLHCEDLDWCMRFRQCGWNIVFVPEARVVHQQGICGKDHPLFVEWHKHRGMMRFYCKFFHHQYPGILLWIVGTGVWLRFVFIAVRTGIRKIFPVSS